MLWTRLKHALLDLTCSVRVRTVMRRKADLTCYVRARTVMRRKADLTSTVRARTATRKADPTCTV